jgi:mannosyltransferase
MTALVLDSIIFGLQRFGGISNFWSRLVEASGQAPVERVDLLMPAKVRAHALPNLSGARVHREWLSPQLSRYLPARVPAGRSVFHTSYYRRPHRAVDRYVASVYDFTYERYFRGLPKRVHHHQKEASIMAADMSVCISEATRADLLACFPKLDPVRTCVVPLGVDQSRFYPDGGNHSGPPFVLFVGQRDGYKRFDLAVNALAITPELALAVVGPPLTAPERERLEQALPGRWTEHGGVGADALRRLYSDAHAFLFPSDYEGFGLPILEAMACGCPAVVADRSSFPEVAGDAALFAEAQTAESYAACLGRLEDDGYRTNLISRGVDRVQLFSWPRTFTKLWKLYE